VNIVPENVDFERYASLPEDEAKVKRGAFYLPQVMDNFLPAQSEAGIALPWDEQKAYVRLRPGKVSLWTGVTHHGKSTALMHSMVYAIEQGEKVCIWSGEETPDVSLETMVVQAMADPNPSVQTIGSYLTDDRTVDSLWFYDQLGVVNPRRLLGVMGYVTREIGVTQFVIDSLMKTSVKGDDYNAQKDFVNELAAFARFTGCHVHIVAHMRKGRDEALGSIMDVKGAGDIINQVDNIFMVWKNKAKIEESSKPNPDPKIMNDPDTVFVVEKQRGRKTWTGRFNLTYHPQYLQFTRRHGEPKRYYMKKRIQTVEVPL
jgi:twinkle protein